MALSSSRSRSIRVALGGVVNWVPLADQLVWPRLVRPRRPLVYLDLNHFILMARAIAADPKTPAGYGELFEAVRAAIEEERIIIPLSG